MATYNSTAMPAGGDGMGLNVNTAATSLAMGVFDSDLAFDDSLLDNVQGISNLPFAPPYDFEPFSATFEDPFSYSSRPNYAGAQPGAAPMSTAGAGPTLAVSAGPSNGGRHAHRHHGAADADAGFADPESSPQENELDNKLLSFSAPVANATLLDETGQCVEAALTAELYGMFFVAEDVFGGEGNQGTARPLELTCYRRNLWQCSGHIALPRQVTHVMLPPEQGGVSAPLLELAASISATESIDGKPTEIISIPWKSTNPSTGGDDHQKSAAAPPRIPIDMTNGGHELDGNFISVPVSWKRLQFKHATANNGRRKGLQQNYVVRITLLGKLGQPQQAFDGGDGLPGASADGFFKLAEVQSGPVIVRGRSPRNFDSRKDVPLISDKKPERRSFSNDPGSTAAPGTALTPGTKMEFGKGEKTQNAQPYQGQGNTQQVGDWTYNNGGNGAPPHPAKRTAISPGPQRPPVPSWSSSSENVKHQPPTPTLAAPSIHRPAAPPMLPINLSLSEDERSPPNRSSIDSLSSPQFKNKGRTSSGHNPGGSPVESADLLYEYFPLSIDDFLEPVDAVYRPHVVHHIRTVEVNPRPVRGGTKRYFVPD